MEQKLTKLTKAEIGATDLRFLCDLLFKIPKCCRGAIEDISQTRQCLVARQTNSCVPEELWISPPLQDGFILTSATGTLHRANLQRRSATAERRCVNEPAQTQGVQIDQTLEQRFLLPGVLRPRGREKVAGRPDEGRAEENKTCGEGEDGKEHAEQPGRALFA